jgi:hypothetical protein
MNYFFNYYLFSCLFEQALLMATSTTMASTMTGMASGGDKVNEGKRLFCYNLSISNLQNCSKAAERHA